MLAEQPDAWIEGRRNLGLDVLAKARINLVPDPTAATEEVWRPATSRRSAPDNFTRITRQPRNTPPGDLTWGIHFNLYDHGFEGCQDSKGRP